MRWKKCRTILLFFFLVHVRLLLVFLTSGLAVRAVPEQQNDEGDREQPVRNADGRDDGDEGLHEVVMFQDNPGIDSAVVTRERLSPLCQILVLIGKQRTGDVGWIPTPFDVDQEGGVPHGLVLQLVVA